MVVDIELSGSERIKAVGFTECRDLLAVKTWLNSRSRFFVISGERIINVATIKQITKSEKEDHDFYID